MLSLRTLSRASIAVFALIVSVPAMADSDDFCGMPSGEPAALQAAVGKLVGVKEILKDQQYVAFQDPAAETVFTFTIAGHNAHPAAVCRKPVKSGDQLTLQMTIVCKGDQESCAKLTQDFKELNARMQIEINQRAEAAR